VQRLRQREQLEIESGAAKIWRPKKKTDKPRKSADILPVNEPRGSARKRPLKDKSRSKKSALEMCFNG
jgi:hypothetical protein